MMSERNKRLINFVTKFKNTWVTTNGLKKEYRVNRYDIDHLIKKLENYPQPLTPEQQESFLYQGIKSMYLNQADTLDQTILTRMIQELEPIGYYLDNPNYETVTLTKFKGNLLDNGAKLIFVSTGSVWSTSKKDWLTQPLKNKRKRNSTYLNINVPFKQGHSKKYTSALRMALAENGKQLHISKSYDGITPIEDLEVQHRYPNAFDNRWTTNERPHTGNLELMDKKINIQHQHLMTKFRKPLKISDDWLTPEILENLTKVSERDNVPLDDVISSFKRGLERPMIESLQIPLDMNKTVTSSLNGDMLDDKISTQIGHGTKLKDLKLTSDDIEDVLINHLRATAKPLTQADIDKMIEDKQND